MPRPGGAATGCGGTCSDGSEPPMVSIPSSGDGPLSQMMGLHNDQACSDQLAGLSSR